ncbi:hypothetical protein [Methylobacterium sp. Leaf111]|uniref:hypothetical protein n=1 Tax=Methylobacterium sp. Leaf111 TaxID=1736257 RepID=UPI000AB43DC3|nr:hypothetical protein [Methylobacterium sp. Leaf111]
MLSAPGSYLSVSVASLLALSPSEIFACESWNIGCEIRDKVTNPITKTADEGANTVKQVANEGVKVIENTAKGGDAVLKKAANEAKKAIDQTVIAANKALDDTKNTATKGLSDTIKAYVKAGRDVVDAGKASIRYVKSTLTAYKETINDAETRIRQGKIVDAFWHASTDQYKHQSDSAFTAAQESEIINQGMATAASAYGGPAGAAAYASWYAYNQTKSLDVALRAGALAGITSAGYASAAGMPSGTVGETIKKAAMTGAIGGAAVAASGGDQDAVKTAFLKSGGMVIVQSGQAYVDKEYGTPTRAKIDSYCTSAIGTKCSVVRERIEKESNGLVKFDAMGSPKVDTNVVLPNRQDIKLWSNPAATNVDLENSIVGQNSTFTKDGKWILSWDMEALVSKHKSVPAIALTYIGTGSSFDDKYQTLKRIVDPSAPVGSTIKSDKDVLIAGDSTEISIDWVPYHAIGDEKPFFHKISPKTPNIDAHVGDIMVANFDIKRRSAPANWKHERTLEDKSVVQVVDIRNVNDSKGNPQLWLRIDLLEVAVSAKPEPKEERLNVKVYPTAEPSSRAIWCIDSKFNFAFEVKTNDEVVGLTEPFTGTAKRKSDGSISLIIDQDTFIAPGIWLPIQDLSNATIKSNGILVRSINGNIVRAGRCNRVL